ncbi:MULTISPECIES: S41 family peptidase [unclassified Novosphingobium]|mgnify:CR=1 FL=1|uniref:S41 family peptidase n=1 Tax=unclassified Novosphingobium TaxID=2644732 RepID=UPI0008690ACD|nr:MULTISPECIES: S41 family peptidase [unclassified Novosphingobium]MBN9142710.1 S41 family peptidase [Novosphingobium sp.]MDR6705794.1 carboxyl-terminal processing protease [Novosphingobium sp. 1748]ODU85114.1 MAG: peptidase S41 [Novosphingobium sp. SCN 63-17]OJX89109.1 MAG: peptidase S41 [Novosphingobium sp. 63-713]
MRSRLATLARAGLLLGAVAMVPVGTAGLAAVDGRVAPQFARLYTVYSLIKAHYVDQTDDEKLVKGAIDGMLSSLDPHSSYLDGASLERLRTMIDGGYAGLGISVVQEDGAVKVVSPMRGSPAEQAGVKAGDYITHLDGKFIVDGDLDDAVAKMRGAAGTQIKLTIYRPGREEPFDLTLTRAVITLEPVTSKLEGNVAVVTVNEFSHDVGRLVFEQIQKQRAASGNRMTGVVLDLRSNPGGELDEAVALSDLFLSGGTVVSQRGRQAGENAVYRAETYFPGDLVKGLPVIVLIDAGSASASEIVAGALQDQHRALIMGERSFGKGSVQTMIPIDSAHAVKLTTARYYTPSGRSVQEGGIEPDIRVPQISDPDARKRSEKALRESDLRRHLVNEKGVDDKKLEKDNNPDPRFKMTPEELTEKGIKDFQLWYALQTINRTATLAAKGK